MLFGNPHKFALWIEHVPELSSRGFFEGLILMIIDARACYSSKVGASLPLTTLNTVEYHLGYLIQEVDKNTSKVDGRPKEELFLQAFGPRADLDWPEEDAIPEAAEIALDWPENGGWQVYLYLDQEEEVVVFARKALGDDLPVYEVRLPKGTCREVFVEAKKYLNGLCYPPKE